MTFKNVYSDMYCTKVYPPVKLLQFSCYLMWHLEWQLKKTPQHAVCVSVIEPASCICLMSMEIFVLSGSLNLLIFEIRTLPHYIQINQPTSCINLSDLLPVV